jgi:hypothetical protein
VRNSSLVECPRADNGSGLKPRTETVDGTRNEERGQSPEGGAILTPSSVLVTQPSPVVGERSDAVKGDPGGRLERSEVRMPV